MTLKAGQRYLRNTDKNKYIIEILSVSSDNMAKCKIIQIFYGTDVIKDNVYVWHKIQETCSYLPGQDKVLI